jgi:hypothetical protein
MRVGGQRHAPAALPLGKTPGTHCIVGWVGPRAGLDWCGKSCPHRDSILLNIKTVMLLLKCSQDENTVLVLYFCHNSPTYSGVCLRKYDQSW